jgi:hypothetical protein
MINYNYSTVQSTDNVDGTSWPLLSSKTIAIPTYKGRPYTEIVDHGYSILKQFVFLDDYVRSNIKDYLSVNDWFAFVNEVRLDLYLKWPHLYFKDGIIPSLNRNQFKDLFRKYNGKPFNIKYVNPKKYSISTYDLNSMSISKDISVIQPLYNFSLKLKGKYNSRKDKINYSDYNSIYNHNKTKKFLEKLDRKQKNKKLTKQRNYDRYTKIYNNFIDTSNNEGNNDDDYYDYDDYESDYSYDYDYDYDDYCDIYAYKYRYSIYFW